MYCFIYFFLNYFSSEKYWAAQIDYDQSHFPGETQRQLFRSEIGLHSDSLGFTWSALWMFRSLFVVIFSWFAFASFRSIQSLSVTAGWVVINAIFCEREIGCRTLIYQSTPLAVNFDFAEICCPASVRESIYIYICKRICSKGEMKNVSQSFGFRGKGVLYKILIKFKVYKSFEKCGTLFKEDLLATSGYSAY